MTKANTITIIALFALALAIISFVSGCAKVTVTRPDGTQIDYTRIGNQQIESFLMEADGSVLMEKQKSDNAVLYDAINKLVEKLP